MNIEQSIKEFIAEKKEEAFVDVESVTFTPGDITKYLSDKGFSPNEINEALKALDVTVNGNDGTDISYTYKPK